ncbi:MAG: cell division protein ZapB [Desulfovibrio sp.]|nr:cell division protein ZapB [Desulfovibrio sp.]
MELLEQLESRIDGLLEGLRLLRVENASIKAESAAIAAERASLEEENRKLREALENGEALRIEARKRIDALLRRIEEHDNVE